MGEDLEREMNRKFRSLTKKDDDHDEEEMDLNTASTKYKQLVDSEISNGFSGSKQLHYQQLTLWKSGTEANKLLNMESFPQIQSDSIVSVNPNAPH